MQYKKGLLLLAFFLLHIFVLFSYYTYHQIPARKVNALTNSDVQLKEAQNLRSAQSAAQCSGLVHVITFIDCWSFALTRIVVAWNVITVAVILLPYRSSTSDVTVNVSIAYIAWINQSVMCHKLQVSRCCTLGFLIKVYETRFERADCKYFEYVFLFPWTLDSNTFPVDLIGCCDSQVVCKI